MTPTYIEVLYIAVREYEISLAKALLHLSPKDGEMYWYASEQFRRACKLRNYLHTIYRRNRGDSK